MNPGLAILKRHQRFQGGTGDIDPTEVHYASDLPANDPRWNAIAKALGVNVDELKKKNLPSQFEQNYENMAQDLLRRVQERSYGDERLLGEKQFDPDVVPIRAPYGGQRYFDPGSSLGVDPITAQGGASNIMQTTGNNPGLRLFMQKQQLKRPRPQGYAKGTLSAKARQSLPRSSFALPGQGTGPKGAGSGSYPIPDKAHARAALSRGAQHASSAQLAQIKRKVHAKFPGMKVT